jgi:hypothetical protein
MSSEMSDGHPEDQEGRMMDQSIGVGTVMILTDKKQMMEAGVCQDKAKT